MCSIINCVGRENAVPIILSGLKKQESQIYNSTGTAVMADEYFSAAKHKEVQSENDCK